MNNTQEPTNNGISSNQKANGWLLIGCGLLVLMIGGLCAYFATTTITLNKGYAAFCLLLFPLAGVALMGYGFKTEWAYRKFGATPLVLDPAAPGVGGQLGGTIHIITDVNANKVPEFRALLTCTHRRQYGKERKDKIRWQEEAPIHWQYNANGAQASFVFEIPEHCWPTKEWCEGSSVDWSLQVEGEFESVGKFDRNWNVVIEKRSALANTEEQAKAA